MVPNVEQYMNSSKTFLESQWRCPLWQCHPIRILIKQMERHSQMPATCEVKGIHMPMANATAVDQAPTSLYSHASPVTAVARVAVLRVVLGDVVK